MDGKAIRAHLKDRGKLTPPIEGVIKALEQGGYYRSPNQEFVKMAYNLLYTHIPSLKMVRGLEGCGSMVWYLLTPQGTGKVRDELTSQRAAYRALLNIIDRGLEALAGAATLLITLPPLYLYIRLLTGGLP